MPKLAPTALILGSFALLAFAFILPSTTPQLAAVGTTATPSVSFTQEEVQGKEGSTVYLKVKLDQPVTRTTKVTIKLTPDQGTTSRDIPGLTGTKTVTFYAGGITTKTVAIKTSRTTAEGDKALTASITKVGNTTVQGDTARVLVKDQKSTGTILTGNNNTTATTTPPANCAQYEGVIPGETRRLSVQQGTLPSYTVNTAGGYSISSEAQAQLSQMQGDFGWPYGGETDAILPSGVAYAYRFKTTEYNNAVPSAITIKFGSSVTGPSANNSGAIMMSIGECPGDFTSPQILSQKTSNNWAKCVGTGFVNGDSGGANLDVAIRGKWANDSSPACLLDENKTYYLNVTAGFSYPGTGEAPSGSNPNAVPHTITPFIGSYANGTNPGQLISRQKIIKIGSFLTRGDASLDVFEVIKNRSDFYSELKRLKKEMSDRMQRRAEACRLRILNTTGPRTGNECAGLAIPEPWFK